MVSELLALCIAAFAAGFIDSIAGGGGLIQTPATFVILPRYPVVNLLGTIKIPSFFGTSIAALQYARKVSIRWKLMSVVCCIALIAAYAGSKTISLVSSSFMKPVIFTVLIIVALYTYAKKTFGTTTSKSISIKKELAYSSLFALVIGFYDGFIGPGTGSFLIVFFISILGFDFLNASAHAKLVNMSTNLGSIMFFGLHGLIIYQYAFPMAACNFFGSILGSRLAILRGNTFIRRFFLFVITATIIRFGYDIFFSHHNN